MNVKSVFKTLAGTIVIICIVSLVTEYYNISMNSAFMKTIFTRTISRSCDYFSQETYKQNPSGNGGTLLNTGNAESIVDKDGIEAVSGRFFEGGTQQAIYDSIYKTNQFKEFLKSTVDYYNGTSAGSISQTPILGLWQNLDDLAYGLFGGAGGVYPPGMTDRDKELGKYYAENQISALNSGVVYLDKDVITRIARWNLTNTLSEGKPSNIVVETGANRSSDYVKHKGFRVYYNTFRITDITYSVYDTSTSGGKKALEAVTNINADNLHHDGDERDNICVAQIKYDVNVAYFGVTPIRQVMKYLFQNQVKGMSDNPRSAIRGYDNLPSQSSLNNKSNKVTNGAGATTWTSPVSGYIYYYIVR